MLPLSLLQALLLAIGQILVKVALSRIDHFEWSGRMILEQLTNGWWLACGLCFGASGILWAYILRHYPFSIAYPLSSMAYIFGLLAAWWLFDEKISPHVWIGVLLIMAGCWLVAK